jgi:formate dehydrogenase major subunit
MHVEGDPDNPVNRGSLCPKGGGVLDVIRSAGRIKYPEVREPGSSEWKRISWEEANTRIAKHMKADRDKNFVVKNADGLTVNRWTTCGFLASSAAGNETGYLSHKVMRSLGMLSIDTQARICHSPSVASLGPSYGRGAMTNHTVDIKNADLILIMGGNAAEAHPLSTKWIQEAKNKRKAKLVVVDPRFTRSAAISDYYAPIRSGTDIAFLGGVINYLISNNKFHKEYVAAYTDASFLVDDGFKFDNGLFSGYDAAKRKYDKESWKYQLGADGFAKVDPTLQHPRCVFQLMKKHYSRYTPEMVTKITGTPKEQFLKICEMMAETAAANKTMTILYALGWTHHSVGSQNIRTMAMVQLLLGNIGVAGGGVNALRGHANVQGITDMCLFGASLPGYLTEPTDKDTTLDEYLTKRTPKLLRPNQMNFWQNYPKFFVSLMKAWYGNAATKANGWGYNWLPKLDGAHDTLAMFDRMHKGGYTGFVCQGFNPLAAVPNKKKVGDALAQLKYLVVIDPMATETSEFWKNYGEFNDVDPSRIQTEVFRLPCVMFAEETGSFTTTSRLIQWHWKAAEGPGETRADTEIVAGIFLALKEMYAKEGGAFPDPILNLAWAYKNPANPSAEDLLMEISGKALGDVFDPKDKTKVLAKAGEQLGGFAQLRDDGTTSCGCWIYGGVWSEKGNLAARRDNADPSGLGQTLNWGFAWPANRRILYNRASCDASGKPWDAKRAVIKWNGEKWAGNDVPDMRPDAKPEEGVNPFIMNPEGVARFFAVDKMAEGPFPEHYEPFETPIGGNPMNTNPKAVSNPASRVLKGDMEVFGTAKDFPYVATTYRLTEHFQFWTQHSRINAVLQPEQFVEIGEELAKEKDIVNGDKVKLRSNRGFIKAVAVVTKRIKALDVDGKRVHTIGIPLHAGFKGVTHPSYITNTLTPYVGDANTHCPEFKSFLVNLEKA